MAGAGAKPFIDAKIKQRRVMLFSKSNDPECTRIKEYMSSYNMDLETYEFVDIECRQDVNQIENYFQIICLTDSRAVPQLFVKGKYIGGEKEITRFHENGELRKILRQHGAIEQ